MSNQRLPILNSLSDHIYSNRLGATSIDEICEVRLSGELGEGGFEILKKNFKMTIR